MDFQMPLLAAGQETAIVTRWLKAPGDRCAAGEPLVEVETEKVNSELESPSDGILEEILVPEGQSAPVGAVIARLSN
ncbi:MAG: lipoyl domain-containing protein [Candidatus Dormibacteraceae bacterium]